MSNKGYVYCTARVGLKTLAAWLRQWFEQGGFRLGMRPDETSLDRFQPDQAETEVAGWPKGRVFNAGRELRWEQQGKLYTVWLLSDKIAPSPELKTVAGGPWTILPGKRPPLYLWGRYDESWSDCKGRATWIEVRIPRPLHYPASVPSAEAPTEALFARIGHIEYCAPNGAVQFTRLTEVK